MDERKRHIMGRIHELRTPRKVTIPFSNVGAAIPSNKWILEFLEFDPEQQEPVSVTFTVYLNGSAALQYVGVPPFRVPFHFYLHASCYTQVSIKAEPQFKGTLVVHGQELPCEEVVSPCIWDVVPGVNLLYCRGLVGCTTDKIHVYKIN